MYIQEKKISLTDRIICIHEILYLIENKIKENQHEKPQQHHTYYKCTFLLFSFNTFKTKICFFFLLLYQISFEAWSNILIKWHFEKEKKKKKKD